MCILLASATRPHHAWRDRKVFFGYRMTSCQKMKILLTRNTSLIPSFLDDRESLFERAILHDDFAEPFHEGPQSRFGHSRDQFVEHAALAEERMGAMLGGVGLEMAVHAETFSGGAEQRQE